MSLLDLRDTCLGITADLVARPLEVAVRWWVMWTRRHASRDVLLHILIDEDCREGGLVECVCSAARRYDSAGHGPWCPLARYEPEVLVVDGAYIDPTALTRAADAERRLADEIAEGR